MKTIVGQKLKIRLESKDPQNARPPIVCPELDVTFCSVMILKKPGPPPRRRGSSHRSLLSKG
jgi:hypothetical protein